MKLKANLKKVMYGVWVHFYIIPLCCRFIVRWILCLHNEYRIYTQWNLSPLYIYIFHFRANIGCKVGTYMDINAALTLWPKPHLRESSYFILRSWLNMHSLRANAHYVALCRNGLKAPSVNQQIQVDHLIKAVRLERYLATTYSPGGSFVWDSVQKQIPKTKSLLTSCSLTLGFTPEKEHQSFSMAFQTL